MIVIVIAGAPVGKGRPKFSRQSGRAYTPTKTANTEAYVKSEAVRQVGQPLLTGPIRLDVRAAVPVPKSWSKKKREAALKNEISPTGTPDADNVAKLYCDALNEIVWVDDSQIVELRFRKFYSDTPSTTLIVEQINSIFD